MFENIPLEHGLIVSAILFCLGLIGLVVRRDLLFILMSLEVMMNSAALAFIVAGSAHTTVTKKVIHGQQIVIHAADGQAMYIMIIALAAAEAAIGLALLLQLYRRFHTIDIDAASEMHG